MNTKQYAILFLIVNSMSFLFSKNLVCCYLSLNNLFGLMFIKIIDINNYFLSSIIYILIITFLFYSLLNTLSSKQKITRYIFLIISLLISIPILNANGM